MILLDLNVLLDVLQKREPHYRPSAALIELVVARTVDAAIPAHGVTTIHYLVARYQNKNTASRAVGWLLQHFVIAEVTAEQLYRALSLGWDDFEDAVVAASAETQGCEALITRDLGGFVESPVPAMTPEEFLALRH